jgi:predicted transcriptional regulator
MQPNGCIYSHWFTYGRGDGGGLDGIFRALADPSRRRLLDSLNQRNGQSLRELCAGLDMARQSVSKHLAILEDAPNAGSTATTGSASPPCRT